MMSAGRLRGEEELEQIKALEVPEMEQAINAYYKITESSRFREIERVREKARHDEASALRHAKMEGAFQTMLASIQNLVDNVGWSVEQAMSALNIPEAEQPKYKEQLQKQ